MRSIKVYKAQALAIVMIVLVISAILGMAMLSRTLKDTQQLASEKSSAEALEFSDSLLDTLKGTSVATLESVCENVNYGEGLRSSEGCSVKGVNSVKEFLDSAGVDSNAINVFDKCSNDNSQVELSAKLAGPEDSLEIPSDGIRSIVVRGQTPAAGCSVTFRVEPRGSSFGTVMVSQVYARNYTNGVPAQYKPYDYTDINQYCIHLTGRSCADNTDGDGAWIPIESGAPITVSLANKTSGGVSYPIDEVRLRAIGGTVAVSTSVSPASCIQNWEMVKITAGANCTGAYRAKEIQIPQQESAISLFDYVLFNGEGVLGPE